MKRINFLIIAVCGMILMGCNGKNTPVDNQETKETELQKAVRPYVENTVIATYSGMASEGITLLDQCEDILDAVEDGKDYTALMKSAGETWRRMRKYWEQSEAFLYGPAEKYDIDPHIDSWPLDYPEMIALLNDPYRMGKIEEEGGAYVGKLDYALKGFHAAEFFLFSEGQPHETNLTHAQAVYLVGIAEDLTQCAIILEDCWAGSVSAEKEKLITDEEGESMSKGENWGEYFINIQHPLWKTYQAVAEQIVAGCVDIAGEVADLKLGNPYRGSDNGGDSEYLESPYSRTSTTDFIDNIISIRNSYCGAKTGDASVSDYVKSKDAALDAEVRATIEESIRLIGEIKDFETTAQDNTAVKAAIDKVSELEEILDDEVLPLLAK